MRRSILSIVLCLCIVLVFPISANADAQSIPYVVDQADILTDQQTLDLSAQAQNLSNTYDVDVLIATVDDMDGMSAEAYAVSLNSGSGWWDSDDAILFLIAMQEREWYIATFGDAISIFSDYSLDILGETAVSFFSEGEYYEGFNAYLDLLPEYFQTLQAGEPIDHYGYDPLYREEAVYYGPSRGKTFWSVLPVSLLIGIAAAAISLLVMRRSMNTKQRQRSAGDYLKQGSYHLRTHQDIFLYSNLSKTRRQENNGGSVGPGGHHGGGSMHGSSGGRSHGGRGGRF